MFKYEHVCASLEFSVKASPQVIIDFVKLLI